jgi:SecA DEAD-like domain
MRLLHHPSSCLIVAGLVWASAVSFSVVDAFVPQRLLNNNNVGAVAFVVEPTTKTSTTTTTALAMGIVEDFVTSTDAKARQATNEKYLAELQQRVDKINALESIIEELDDEALQAKTKEFQQRLQKSGNKEDVNGPLLEEAFAVVREAAW